MQAPPTPYRLDLVLIGGGHSHVSVLRSFGMKPEPGVRLTMIAKEWDAPYSGMLPGLIAGHYTDEDCHINLVRLARFANARLIRGEAIDIDRKARRVLLADRPPIAFDLLSIDTGLTPSLAGIEGAENLVLVVKPISALMPKWRALEEKALKPNGPRRFAVAGGGAAGFELIHALSYRFRNEGGGFSFALISGNGLLPKLNPVARRLAYRSLAAENIALVEHDPLRLIEDASITLESGRRLSMDAVLIATGGSPATWLKSTGLATADDGFLAVRPTLQSIDDDDIFAAGDCATVLEHRRDKAGVFAVRQGPPLAENLRRRARGEKAEPFTPQSRYLILLSTGRKHAIAVRGSVAVSGDWAWRWKDWIDGRFMRKFNALPSMAGQTDETAMRCGGCAAKIGPFTLSRALDRLNGLSSTPDDAAVIETGGAELRLETVDFFRAFWPDPYVFGVIAAHHALSDIYAMGGTPQHAMATAVIPYAKPKLIEEDLFQLLAGAKSTFDRSGVSLIGGHSSEGAELAAGFSVSGTVPRQHLQLKCGLKAGDMLLLTKPLGTGILFAAEMRGMATAPAIAATLAGMQESNREPATILSLFGARAMTDITGFGLVGHLLEMLKDLTLQAILSSVAIPVYPQVKGLAAAGVRSTLLAANLEMDRHVNMDNAEPFIRSILFDPQTSGGLLAGLPAEGAASCLAELKRGPAPEAAIIGRIVPASGHKQILVEC